jgi:hypothetical protein
MCAKQAKSPGKLNVRCIVMVRDAESKATCAYQKHRRLLHKDPPVRMAFEVRNTIQSSITIPSCNTVDLYNEGLMNFM